MSMKPLFKGMWTRIHLIKVSCILLSLSTIGAAEQALAEGAMPREHREFLQRFVGSWEFAAKAFSPTGELLEQIEGGQATYQWILEDDFLEERFQAVRDGKAWLGLGIYGYDSVRQQMIWLWFANTDTGVFNNAGQLDDSGNVLTLNGHWPDAHSGEILKGRTEISHVSEVEYHYKLFTKPEGSKEYLYSTLVFKRR